MGLDITAYSELEEVDQANAFDEDGDLIDEKYVAFYTNSDFPGHECQIKDGIAYKSKDSMGFRAGSYSGYSAWREKLAEIAGYKNTEDPEHKYRGHSLTVWRNPVKGPFVELINFSDCEGVIGSEISKKLHNDFLEFKEVAMSFDNEAFKKLYIEWENAFKLASNNGAVSFW